METFTGSNGIKVAIESLIGGRSENQDSFGVAQTPNGLLIIVCDGLGGRPAGKKASEIATETIIDSVTNADPCGHKASILLDAIFDANNVLLSETRKNPALKGMGTTCVCLLMDQSKAFVAHVGDSRCYQLRGNKIVFRTSDHSYVGEMVSRGTLTEEESRNNQYSNIITRAIGGDSTIEPEIDILDYTSNDRFALMTDGIWGLISEPNLLKLLTHPENPASVVSEVVGNLDALGKDKGGSHDNMTLALIDLATPPQPILQPEIPDENLYYYHEEEDDLPAYKSHSKRRSRNLRRRLLSLIAVLAAILILIILFFSRDDNQNEITVEEEGPITELPMYTPIETKGKQAENNLKEVSEEIPVNNPEAKEHKSSLSPQSYFKEAVSLLDSLQTYDPPGKDFDRRRADRKKIIAAIKENLQNAVDASSEPRAKDKAEDILQMVVDDSKKLLQIDKKGKRSTKECIETIESIKKKLVKLTD